MADLRKELNTAKEAEKEIKAEMAALCISGRNQYLKGAIQQDFAAGIKELDQEIAAEEDEETFDPDDEVRDYKAVARSLPVFCVSSARISETARSASQRSECTRYLKRRGDRNTAIAGSLRETDGDRSSC